MSPLIKELRKKSFCVITIMCLILTGSLTLSVVETINAPVTFDSYGNLNVTGGDSYVIKNYPASSPFKHNGNIFVVGGSSLTILNSYVVMNPDSNVTVTGGSTLKIVDSTITVDKNVIQATYDLFFQIEDSDFQIINSTFICPGTFNISFSNLTVVNSDFDQLTEPANLGSPTLIFNSSNVYYEDCMVKSFDRYDDMSLLGYTNFTAINTFFDLDFIGESVMIVDGLSNADLYGVSINPGTWPYSNSPIQIKNLGAWVNIYRWLYLNVTDLLNIPVGNTTVSAKNINLNQYTPIPPQFILDYLNKGNITNTDYNITNSSGYVVLPLHTDNITYLSAPNSKFVGNYEVTAYYDQYKTTMNVGLASYPIMTDAKNNPKMTLKFSDLLLPPVNNTYFSNSTSDILISSGVGVIRDSIYQKPGGGVVDVTYGQQGNIRVKGSGALELYSTGLGIEQDANNKYYILIEENGVLKLKEQSAIMDGVVTPGKFPINLYINDSAELTLNEGSILKNIGALGIFKNSKISLDNSEIHGGLFYVNGINQNLIVSAINDSKINVSTLSLANAQVNLENSNISTKMEPTLSNLLMESVKNCTFNKPLTFTSGSIVELINVTEPDFFNITAKDTSRINVSWWLRVIVKDEQGNRLEGVSVTIQNYTTIADLWPTPYGTGITDENGVFSMPTLGGIIYCDQKTNVCVREYGGILGNYKISASFAGRTSSRQGFATGDTNVFGGNQEVIIIIPGGPDLVVTDIKFNPDPGVKDEEVNIIATIKNEGIFNASNIKVQFWDTVNNVQLGDTQTIMNLEPDEQYSVSIPQIFFSEGDYDIKVIVDPNNLVGETNEFNNEANATLTILNLDTPDLTFVANSLYTAPLSPISMNSSVKFGARIINVGDANAGTFKVRFNLYYTGVIPEIKYQIGNDTLISRLGPGITTDVVTNIPWIANMTGPYRIEALVDVTNLVPEESEMNNTISSTFEVVIGPDLTVTSVSFDPEPPITRQTDFAIIATIANVGPSKALNVTVGFYLDKVINQIGEVVIENLSSSESTQVQISTNIPTIKEVPYKIWVIVDPSLAISEINEDNNTFQTEITIMKKADLSIEAIQFQKSDIENGEDTNITAIISNIGQTSSEGFTVTFYDGNPATEGIQIKAGKTHAGLDPGDSYTFKVTWNSTQGGVHNIYVVITTTTDEEIEGKNIDYAQAYVKTKPDLFISKIFSNKEKDSALVKDPVDITITLRNGGDSGAYDFSINFWDGPPGERDEPFKTITVKSLLGKSYNNYTARYNFSTEGYHYVNVIVDQEDVVSEINENNNTAIYQIMLNRTASDLRIVESGDEILPLITNIPGLATRTIVNGEHYKLNFTIINEGNEIAENFTVHVLIGEDLNEIEIGNITIESLGFYKNINDKISIETPTVTAKYNAKNPDYQKITIWLDRENTNKEKNEDNNILEIPQGLKVIKADVQLDRVEVFRDGVLVHSEGEQLVNDIKGGDELEVRVFVKNLGSEVANATVQFYKDEDLLSSSLPDVIAVDQEKIFVHTGLVVEYGKSFNIKAAAFQDRDENPSPDDNEESIAIIVSDEGAEGDEDSSLLLWLIIIIIIVVICLIVVTLFLMRRKREKMAECSECGALIPVDATGCPKCGAEFSDEIECGECGALMKITDTKCPVCGAVFTKEAEAEAEEGLGPEEEGKPGKPPEPSKPASAKKAVAAKPKAAEEGKPPAATPAARAAAAPPVPAPPPGAKPSPEAAPAAPAAEEGEEKAECYRCGAIVPLSASMCPECGAEFE